MNQVSRVNSWLTLASASCSRGTSLHHPKLPEACRGRLPQRGPHMLTKHLTGFLSKSVRGSVLQVN